MKTRRDSDVTTSGRIERKRAHDREAQRASRAKTKAYITHLEKTVADLTKSSGDDRANYLAEHATRQSQEIEGLQGLVTKIRTLIHDSTQSDSNANGIVRLKSESPTTNHTREASAYQSPPESAECSSDSPKSHVSGEIPRSASDHDTQETKHLNGTTRNLVLFGESLLCEDTDDRGFFDRLCRVLEQLEACPDHLSSLAEDEDILVRAIVDGWDAAERVHHFDIVWRFLRAFDEGFWYRAAPIVRFANHWMMRSTLLHKMCPKNQERRKAPAFMNPTLHQMVVQPHHVLADYYVWPKLRDLVIDRGGLHVTGRTSIAFITAIRFDWPYELRDAYHKNTTSGMYELSPTFQTRFHDLSNYRLEPPSPTPTTNPLHPAMAFASDPIGNETLLGWHTDVRTPAYPGASARPADFSLKKDLSSPPPPDTAAMLAAAASCAAAHAKGAPEWMPSLSMDVGSEAAFLEYAMDQWPVL